MNKIFFCFILIITPVIVFAQLVCVDQPPAGTVRFVGDNRMSEIGFSVVPIGHFNEDSQLDYAVADPLNNRVFIVTPRDDSKQFNLNNLFFSRNGFTVSGNVNSDFGLALSAIGDFNQDGFDDLAIGARFDGEGGKVYILAGTTARTDVAVSNTDKFILIVEGSPGELLGQFIGRKVNLNQDRFTDLLLPSEFRTSLIDNELRVGSYHVIYGSNSFTEKTGTVDILDSTGVLTIVGPSFSELAITKFGTLMEPVGDVTGDGKEDVGIFYGIDLTESSSQIIIIPGGNTLFGTQPIERLLFPTAKIRFQVFSDPLMHDVSDMVGSDINQDGISELIVGFNTANISNGFQPKGAIAVIQNASGADINSLIHPDADWYGHWKTNSRFGNSLSISDSTLAVGAPFADSPYGDQNFTGAVYFLTINALPSGQVNPSIQHAVSAVIYGGTGSSQFGASIVLADFNHDSTLDVFTNSVGDRRSNGATAYQIPVVSLKGDFDLNRNRNHRDLMILSHFWRTTEPSVNLVQEDVINAYDILLWKENAAVK